MSARASRRAFLACACAGAASLAIGPRVASAMGRTPLGGRVTLHVPWPVASIDPHDLLDPAAALFASAIADPIYGLDANGYPYPTLTAALPVREAGETIVRLREGLHTARLAALDARDLVASVERARARGAAAILDDVPKPKLRKGDPFAAVFGAADPYHLARALSSPLVALLPRRFNPATPDGTGAFRADVSAAGLILTRNLNAARGPAYLDAIDVAPAEDLKTSLRAFEAEHDDIGWLGMGLHTERKDAVRFDLGRAAWVVLVIGPDAGAFGAPGAAQTLVDAIPPERLAHLGLGPLPPATGDPAWTGQPSELLADDASPHLVEVARAVAPVLSRPGHEITVTPLPRAEIARRRARSRSTLALEIVRPLGPSAHHTLMALGSAEDASRGRDLAKVPLHGAGQSARSLTAQLRVGVLGDVKIAGGVVPDLVLAHIPGSDGWDLGASYYKPPKKPV